MPDLLVRNVRVGASAGPVDIVTKDGRIESIDQGLEACPARSVTVSHGFCLCDDDPAIPALIEQLGQHRIALATVAPGNVDPLPLDLIDEHRVAICLGQDGIRDLWSPWGDADMLARAAKMAWRAGYRTDADIERCIALASTRGAAAIGVTDLVLAPGGRGELVVVDAMCPAEAAVTSPPRTMVIKAGDVVYGNDAPDQAGRTT